MSVAHRAAVQSEGALLHWHRAPDAVLRRQLRALRLPCRAGWGSAGLTSTRIPARPTCSSSPSTASWSPSSERRGRASRAHFPGAPTRKDTPDVVIYVVGPRPALIAIEAKMYDRPTTTKLNEQLGAQTARRRHHRRRVRRPERVGHPLGRAPLSARRPPRAPRRRRAPAPVNKVLCALRGRPPRLPPARGATPGARRRPPRRALRRRPPPRRAHRARA